YNVFEPGVPTIKWLSPAVRTPGTTVGVSIYGLRMLGTSAITFSGTGVTGTITSGSDMNTAFATVTVAAGAPLGVRDFTITNAYGTSAPFTGFTVANQTTMP